MAYVRLPLATRRLAYIALLVAACSAPASPTANLDPTGILLVEIGEQVQSRFTTETMAQAASDAAVLAEVNGRDLGYPWIDPATGELVLSAVTQRGRDLITSMGLTVPHRVRQVVHGAGELQMIQDDVTLLRSRGVPNAELIYALSPDERDNRVLIRISTMNRALLEYLAAHYPPDAIAVMVDPGGPGGAPATTP